ncbi:MAG TPA: altronate dehydratase family protein [Bacteroidia bacterium]|nr:altronate dehydratase family protein [Bacteroidia bacterium]
MNPALLIDPTDNLGVALRPLAAGEPISLGHHRIAIAIAEPIPAKQKFALAAMEPGDRATLYGVTVGIVTQPIPAGGLIGTGNLRHDADGFSRVRRGEYRWEAPDVERWRGRTFDGYHRSDGSVGTANHWLVIPMVFCETRNVNAIRAAFERALGYERTTHYQRLAARLVEAYRAGESTEALLAMDMEDADEPPPRVFPNLDGVQFLTHSLGCGGTRHDAAALCGLLAGYITHPNVAGATVLSLGCENAQLDLLEAAIRERSPGFDKSLLTYRQQGWPDERTLLDTAIKETFAALVEANRIERRPAPLAKLCVGVECGGSDGFSGISANPTLGALSDRLVALGGRVVLAEFPELCGVEQELVDRCVSDEVAGRFVRLTSDYAARAKAVGSDFSQNPSPGNIRDGLVTDAIKSAGAAKKGGTSPVVAALDYPEIATRPGLSLLCTPGGDGECTTALAGAHANVILFTTGLGTPMGNPVCPVVKVSTSTELAQRLPDLIDYDTGPIIRGEATIDELGEELLDLVVEVASGRVQTKAQALGQSDFHPWKRDVSL